MNLTRGLVVSGLAGALVLGTTFAAYELAEARQRPVVCMRYLLGYFDGSDRFVAVAGRNSTDVPRNAVSMFVFSGAVDTGRKLKATLPMTLSEQAQFEADLIARGDQAADGIELGVVPRKKSPFRQARLVAGGSVDTESVQVRQSTGTGLAQAPGVYFKVFKKRRRGRLFRNRFTFNPQFVSATFANPREIDYNPTALDANTLFTVTMDGGPDPSDPFNLVTNLDGIPLGEPFSETFTTGERYVQDFTRPNVETNSPGVGAENVPADADIEITFSEPMDISTFSPPRFQGDEDWTIRVSYTASGVNGALAGQNIFGTVRLKPQTAGTVVQFRPTTGFGPGPHEILVQLTAGVTDLSGNNIVRQQEFRFTTVFDPDAPGFSILQETFEDRDQVDTDFENGVNGLGPSGDNLVAQWNVGKSGALTTSVQEQTFIANGTTNNTLNTFLNQPLIMQMLFPNADMGDRPRTIIGFDWNVGTLVGNQTYPNFGVRIGNATNAIASAGFSTTTPPNNTSFGGPIAVVVPPTNYTTPGAAGTYAPGPTWSRNFEYDGNSAVVMEVSHNGHGGATDERWGIDPTYPINTSKFQILGATPGPVTARPLYHDTQFRYLTPGAEAQSLWYNVGRDNALYLPQQIVPFTPPQGTSVVFEWQGARGDEAAPDTRDSATETDWTNDVRQLANFRFVRFRVTLNNNLATRESPRVDDLTVPYTFQR